MPRVVVTPIWTSGGAKTGSLRTEIEVQEGDGRGLSSSVVVHMTTGGLHLSMCMTAQEWNAMAQAVDALLYDARTRKDKQ